MAVATTPGATRGSTTWTKVCILLAPSILAASSISRGTVLKNPVRRDVYKRQVDDLDAVVVKWVVAGRNHNSAVKSLGAHHIGHAGGGGDMEQIYILSLIHILVLHHQLLPGAELFRGPGQCKGGSQ